MGNRTIVTVIALALVGGTFLVVTGGRRRAPKSGVARVDSFREDDAPDRDVDLIKPTARPATGGSRHSAPVAAPAGEPESDADEAGVAEAPVSPTATLYQHATHDRAFPGLSWIVGVGLTEAGYEFKDDEASAVDVPEGFVLVLYTDHGGVGQRTTIASGLHNLAPYGFNDCVSSLRLVRADRVSVGAHVGSSKHVLLYENAPQQGSEPGLVWTLRVDADRTSRLFTAVARELGDNAASAVHVPPGFEVTLFDEPDGRGTALVLGPGSYELEVMGFDGRTSSVRVRRMEDGD